MNKNHNRTPSSTSTNKNNNQNNQNKKNNNSESSVCASASASVSTSSSTSSASSSASDASTRSPKTNSPKYNSFKHHTIIIPQTINNQNQQQQQQQQNKNNNNNNNNNSTILIILTSIITSSLSSILLSRLTTKLNYLPLSTYPTLEFISLTIITRIPNFINPIQSSLINHHFKLLPSSIRNNSSSTSSSSSNLSSPSSSSNIHNNNNNINSFHPRFPKWRWIIKFTLPIALLNLITSWSKSHIAAQLSCSTWQAFDIYSLPIAFVVLNRLPWMNQSNPQLFPILSITSFTITLLIFNQSVFPSVILLALISATSQALYLILLKTWLHSFPHMNPSHPLACSSPFSLLFVLLPTLFQFLFHSSDQPFDNPLHLIPPINSIHTLSILLYALLRLSERLTELWALHRFKSPLSVLLLIPSRNLVSIVFSQFSGFYLGRLGSYLSFLVYAFSIWAIYLAQIDTNHCQFYNFLSSHSPHHSFNHLLPFRKKTSPRDQQQQQQQQPLDLQHEHHDQRRRSSTGGLIHHQGEYHLETIQEKASHLDHHLIVHHHPHPHHSSTRQHRRHHQPRLSVGGAHHSEDRLPTPIRFRKPFLDRDGGYDHHHNTRNKQHWMIFFQVLAFGTLPMMMVLKLVLRSQVGLPVTEVAIGTVRPPGSVDLVFSYYNEPLNKFSAAVEYVRTQSALAAQNPRVIVYVKHPSTSLATIRMTVNADEVIRLKNVGREGGTYLTHILRHYNSSLVEMNPTTSVQQRQLTETLSRRMSPITNNNNNINVEEEAIEGRILEQEDLLGLERISSNSPIMYGLADHTVFMQPEIAWHWIAKPRMNLFNPKSTGFLSFGPYLLSVCGQDGLGNGNYERMRDIYTIFHDTFCPPTGQLASYAGQFVVSRRRILQNGYIKYKRMRELLEAPIEHWIHREGGWLKWKGATDEGEPKIPVGPNAPFLGHALERSWPVLFHCTDPNIAQSCTDDVVDQFKCQCFD